MEKVCTRYGNEIKSLFYYCSIVFAAVKVKKTDFNRAWKRWQTSGRDNKVLGAFKSFQGRNKIFRLKFLNVLVVKIY